jgi:Na+/melibiose symporter-like transporter
MGGGLASFLLFIIIQNLSAGTDEQSFIFIGVVVISSIICACAAWIVQTLKGFNSKEDKGD